MSDPKDIDMDLKEYLDKEPNLNREDRIKYLKAVFGKHFTISELDHSVNYYDLQTILSMAKSQWVNQKLPMSVSKKQILSTDINSVVILESVLNYLNSKKLLKKLVKIDYTE